MDRRAREANKKTASHQRTASKFGMALLCLLLCIAGKTGAQDGSYPDTTREVNIQPGMPTTATGDPHTYRSSLGSTPAPNNFAGSELPNYSAPPEPGYSTTSIEVQTGEDDEEDYAPRPVHVTRYLHGSPRGDTSNAASRNRPAASGSVQKGTPQSSGSGGGYTIISPSQSLHSPPLLTRGMSSNVLPYALFPFAASIAYAMRRLTRGMVVKVFVKVVVDNATNEIVDIIVETAFGKQSAFQKVAEKVYETYNDVQKVQKDFDSGCLDGTLSAVNVLGNIVSGLIGIITYWAVGGIFGYILGFFLSVLVQFFVQLITDLTRLSLSYFAFRP